MFPVSVPQSIRCAFCRTCSSRCTASLCDPEDRFTTHVRRWSPALACPADLLLCSAGTWVSVHLPINSQQTCVWSGGCYWKMGWGVEGDCQEYFWKRVLKLVFSSVRTYLAPLDASWKHRVTLWKVRVPATTARKILQWMCVVRRSCTAVR